MLNPKLFDEIAHQLAHAVPPELRSLCDDLEKNFKNILQNAFNRMDLVTRDEFDVQVKVLQKTRMRLTEMEHIVSSIEAQSATKQ